jgi:hypothetical protein
MFDVFISYKLSNAEAVRVLAEILPEKDGLEIWSQRGDKMMPKL